ncbi:MAG: hypothetical protein JST35_07775 [Armatimonadetes bacterium]|nr:hypothetical protein [Armatimonadota bacterium]
MKPLFIPLLLAAAISVHAQDKVLKTRTVKGSLVKFETGDYLHAIIKTGKTKTESFFLAKPGLEYFLALNAKKPGVFTIEHARTKIEEAGGMVDIDRISDAKFGKLTYKAWYAATRKKMTPEQMDKTYGPLIGKLSN